MSIKTGGCSEDCGYCPQSAHFETSVEASKLMPLSEVVNAAQGAKAQGATRFCMGAAWRSPKPRDMERVTEMAREVKALRLEMKLGMLDADQAQALDDAGLAYYNHNLDSAPEFYASIISTRTYQERLDTLAHVRQAGIKVCSGGIVAMGESRAQRAGLIAQLANLDPYPGCRSTTSYKCPARRWPAPRRSTRSSSCARSRSRASRCRRRWCACRPGASRWTTRCRRCAFAAGANSLFYGDRLLTTSNPQAGRDRALFERLGLKAKP